ALAAATLLALSPTAIVASTRADGAILLALLALVAATLSTSDASPARATLLGAAVAGAALAHPLGWFVVTGVVLVAAVRTRPRAAFWVPFAAGTLVTLGLTSSLLFTRPAGFAAFLAASWSSLRHDYLAPVGTAWHRPLVLLATDEFPVLVAGITGAVLAVRGRVDRWHLWLSLAVLVLAAALGGGSLAASTAVTLAVGITGAFGLAASIAAVPWTSLLDRWNAATTGAVALTVFVALSLIGRLFGGPAGDTVAWLTGLVSLVLLLLVALWVVRSLWPYASAGRWIPLVLVLLALATLASRNAMLANATTSYRPGTLLHASDASPGLVVAVDRLRRASMDLTMFQFDPRDPTGGHGLIVVVADEIGQPFAWYLRDFPNLQRVPSDRLDQAVASAQVVIVTAADQARVAALRPDLVWQPVPYRLEPPASLAAPDWRRLVLSLVDPRDWRAYVSFLLYRRVSVPTPPESILVGLSPEVAARAGYPAVP
ncbi:MAG: hypothetical protein N2Z82_09270, partial [Thermomicrobium sp.]|nr:hypothetical protein [Thermomicrobium sp.]